MIRGGQKMNVTETKRKVEINDLYKLSTAYDAQLSPDGKSAVYVVRKINEETAQYVSNLYVVDLETKEERQWTFGEHLHQTPTFSPDGAMLAFVSNRTKTNQIYLLPVNGGEAKQLTFFHKGASNPIWSPDGNMLLCSAGVKSGETIHTKEEQNEKKELQPLVVDRLIYKADGRGFIKDTYSQIALIHIDSGESVQLTQGDHSYAASCWSPDGTAVVYSANLSDDPDAVFTSDLYVYNIDSKETVNLTTGQGSFGRASWSPDGSYLAFLGSQEENQTVTTTKIWLYDFSAQKMHCITQEWDVDVEDVGVGDLHSWRRNPGLIWTADSEGFYFLMSDQGNVGVYHGTVEGELTPVLFENLHVYDLSVHSNGQQAVVGISTPTLPGELYTLNLTSGDREQITHLHDTFLDDVVLAGAESFTIKASDGWDLQCWLMKPAGYEEGEKYPLILEIHGGPHMMYGNTFVHEFQTLTASGYGVLYINPRGSKGYGQVFADAVRGDYGGKDYQDLMDAVDYVIREYDFVDEMRLGVTGGSYGGFMTNWIVGQTDRFKAAVTQRSISNWISFYGVSDIGYFFTEREIKSDLYDNIEALWKHSPLRLADKVNTPLLILHGELDYRCPIEQGEQLFNALKRKGKETRFIRFPEATHDLSRSGDPKLRLDRLTYIRDWFHQYV